MLTKTMTLKLGVALAGLLTASVAGSASAQPYGRYDGNDYGRTYDSGRDYERDQYARPDDGRGYDSNDRDDRDRYGYESPRIPGRTFSANDQPGQRLTGTRGDDVFHAGHSAVVMTGGPGSDRFIFDVEPWNAGHITDFMPGEDILDFRPLFLLSNYRGNNPLRDGALQFKPAGAGTEVYFKGPVSPWPTHVTTLDNIRPDQIRSNDWLFR